jgi:FkbM family methyltransferase
MGTYTKADFLEHVDFTGGFKTIFELGSRDGIDSLEIFRFFEPEALYVFEADPENYRGVIDYLKSQDLGGKVRGFNLAVSHINGQIPFHIHPDHGSSSILRHPRDACEQIMVNSVTLDSFCGQMNIPAIDMIFADIEGAELLALMNQRIMHTCRYVICECAVKPEWKPGYPLLSVLAPYGLKRKVGILAHNDSAGDFLYTKENQ